MTTISVKTVAEMWPEHEGHDVRYSEFGRTDYRLTEVELVDLGGEYVVQASSYEPRPVDGLIEETSMWCADCRERLIDYEEKP